MGQLVTEALRICKEDGEPFTYLMPAAEAIYRPYDFVSAGWCDKFVIEAEEVEEVEEVEEAAILQASGCYCAGTWTGGINTKCRKSYITDMPV